MANGFANIPPLPQQLLDNAIEGNVGGIISTRPQAKYMSGARCILRINGKPAAFAFAVSWHISTSYRELNSIDSALPDELVPRNIKVEGSISALHVPGRGVGVLLWQPDILSFLFHQYIQIEVRDSKTDELLFFAPKAVITSRQEEIRVDQLANVSLNFMAMGWRDEREPSLPKGAKAESSKTNNSTTASTGDKIVSERASADSTSNKVENVSTPSGVLLSEGPHPIDVSIPIVEPPRS